MGRLLRRFFQVSPEQAKFDNLGFAGDERIRERLERVGGTFLDGYNPALEHYSDLGRLAEELERFDPWFRGFAYEGAGFGLAVVDTLMPWRESRLRALLAGPGASYVHIIHVGAGWLIPRLRVSPRRLRRRLDPLLGWLTLDGYGFHEGYFHHRRTVEEQRVPRRLWGYERRVFDQGLGRSLWFSEAATAQRLIARLERFPMARRSDLWSGVGLASAYAGGMDATGLRRLLMAAGVHRPALAQGVAFGVKARLLAGLSTDEARLAAEVVCATTAQAAAAATDDALSGLPPDGAEDGQPAFEIWRRRIAGRLEARGAAA